MAAFFEVSYDTLTARCVEVMGKSFPELFKMWSVGFKISLRRAQYEKAIYEKSERMQIWLGKQMLDQKDQVVASHIEIPVPQYIVERDVTETTDDAIQTIEATSKVPTE